LRSLRFHAVGRSASGGNNPKIFYPQITPITQIIFLFYLLQICGHLWIIIPILSSGFFYPQMSQITQIIFLFIFRTSAAICPKSADKHSILFFAHGTPGKQIPSFSWGRRAR
jgi:hypothetical protein